jgi:hypothetical protein
MNPTQRKKMQRTIQEAAEWINNCLHLKPGLVADIEVLATDQGFAEDDDGIRSVAYQGWRVEDFQELLGLIS